jgi:hypothetical protein
MEEKMNRRKLIPTVLIVFLLAGCNLPTAPTSDNSIPSLDQTVTALFKTAVAQPATATPGPQVATATKTPVPQAATNTNVPPSNTPPPTNTAPPANTPVPPTATQPSRRGGLSVEAVHWSGSGPTLDGDWGEWKSVGREYPATNVVYGKSKWDNEDDLAGSFYTGWDANYLYIAVKVRDDKYVQNATGQNIFKGDSVELLIDTNLLGDYYDQKLSGDDYQIGISAGRPTIGDGNAEAYLWFPSGKAGAPAGVKIAGRDEGSVYRLEAAIPWAVLGVTPQSGMRLGFALSISDCDTPGATAQESMVSSAPGRDLTDPTSWHDLLLK